MNKERRTMLAFLGSVAALAPFATASLPARAQAAPAPEAAGAALAEIKLSRPRFKGGMRIMQALANRQSRREFAPRPLSRRHLSELLWAGFGVNRPDDHRTAPTWRGMRCIDVYVVMREGVYTYDAAGNRLVPYKAGNFLAMTGTQDFVPTAPLNLLYVADLTRMGTGAEQDKKVSAAADAGCIGENVYLYCASEGLATVFRGNVDRAPLHKALELKPEQHIAYAQTVGHPK